MLDMLTLYPRVTLATVQERRGWDAGTFGAIAPYRCEFCGPCWLPPRDVLVSRGNLTQPDEWGQACRECGRDGEIERTGTEGHALIVLNRRRVVIP